MFEKISNPDWKIAVKKPDFVRADVFELCLIIADLLGIYWAFIERSVLNCRWGNIFRSTGAYTLFENATFKHERGARSLDFYFLEILPPPGGFVFVYYARSCFWEHISIICRLVSCVSARGGGNRRTSGWIHHSFRPRLKVWCGVQCRRVRCVLPWNISHRMGAALHNEYGFSATQNRNAHSVYISCRTFRTAD